MRWINQKILYKGKRKVFKNVNTTTPLSLESFNNALTDSFHIGLYTKGSEYMCIDIDSIPVADAVMGLVKDLKVLAIRTPRGGVHLYFKKPELYALYDFGNSYRATQLSVVVEMKTECMVTTFGPGYTIFISPEFEDLDPLLDVLFPLPWTPGRSKLRNKALVREELIREGTRNQTLFEWSSFMMRNLDVFLISRETVIQTLAEHFGLLPLTDQNEIDSLIHVENRIEVADPNDPESFTLEPSKWAEHFFKKWGLSKFRYHNVEQDWFEYKDEDLCWKRITEIQFHSEIYKEFSRYPQSKSLKRTTFLKNFTQIFALSVLLTEEEIQGIVGISFLNGFLDFKTMLLKPHSLERFVTSVLPIDYNPSDQLTDRIKLALCLFCQDNTAYINHLRGFIRRALILEPSCHTVLLI